MRAFPSHDPRKGERLGLARGSMGFDELNFRTISDMNLALCRGKLWSAGFAGDEEEVNRLFEARILPNRKNRTVGCKGGRQILYNIPLHSGGLEVCFRRIVRL